MASNESVVVVVDGAMLPAAAADRVRALSPRIELIEHFSPDALKRAHVVFTEQGRFDPVSVPCLKWVQTESASITHLMDTKLASSNIPVANAGGALSANVAELAFGLLLALTRRLNDCHRIQAKGRWPQAAEHRALYGDHSYGKTLGILGYGSIGRQVARIASGLGMQILAYNRAGRRTKAKGFSLPNSGDPEGDFPAWWCGLGRIDEMLPRCDVVVLCLPLTAETHHLVGAAALQSLPNHAYLIDVGRGGVLDLHALCDCLHAGRLAGAALDVYEQEPLPAEHPLWRAPNVLLSPHIGAGTKSRNDFVARVLVENLSRFLDGRPLVNLVDFKQGY